MLHQEKSLRFSGTIWRRLTKPAAHKHSSEPPILLHTPERDLHLFLWTETPDHSYIASSSSSQTAPHAPLIPHWTWTLGSTNVLKNKKRMKEKRLSFPAALKCPECPTSVNCDCRAEQKHEEEEEEEEELQEEEKGQTAGGVAEGRKRFKKWGRWRSFLLSVWVQMNKKIFKKKKNHKETLAEGGATNWPDMSQKYTRGRYRATTETRDLIRNIWTNTRAHDLMMTCSNTDTTTQTQAATWQNRHTTTQT